MELPTTAREMVTTYYPYHWKLPATVDEVLLYVQFKMEDHLNLLLEDFPSSEGRVELLRISEAILLSRSYMDTNLRPQLIEEIKLHILNQSL